MTTICHIPPGNPENPQTIEIPDSAVGAHLRHGDTLGPCPEELVEDDKAVAEAEFLDVNYYTDNLPIVGSSLIPVKSKSIINKVKEAFK